MPGRIVIVGGGFTGLVAARTLARSGAGFDITVLERGPELGGLAAGFAVCGTSLEKAYHYLLLSDESMLALVRELGLEEDLLRRPSTVGIYLGGRIHPFSTARDLLRFPACSLLNRLRLGATVFYLQQRKDWRPLARQGARDWLRRAVGDGAMRAVWDPLLRGKFDAYADSISMAWLWARIHTRANSRLAGREWLIYPRGGFRRIVARLEQELLANGVHLHVNAPVQHLTWDEGHAKAQAGGAAFPFDQCLFTGPSSALAELLPADGALAAYREQLQSVPYLDAVCLVFVSDQSLAGQYWINVHEADAPFLVFIEHTRLVGTELYDGRHVYYLGCYRPPGHRLFEQDDATISAEWFAFVQRMFPHFDRSRVLERHVFRFRGAQHVVDCDYERRIPGFRTPLRGLYLANFSQIFPEDRGTNFAVRDGQRVAALMLEDWRTRSAAHAAP